MSDYKKITANSGLISFGNTGARLSDPRSTYLKILNALVQFRVENENWETNDQALFGALISELGIFEIKTDNVLSSDKDVRVKTGFISQLGFTTEARVITSAGRELLENSLPYEANVFDITGESYIYLKQFLKYQQIDFEVFPLLSLIYAVIEFENQLPIDFITYIWSGSQTKSELLENILNYKNHSDFKLTIYQSILNSKNTKIAEKNIQIFSSSFSFLDKENLKELMYAILPHGKGDTFKNKAISLLFDIHEYWLKRDEWNEEKKKQFIIVKLISRHKDISSKKSSFYLEMLFNTKKLNKSSNWLEIIAFFEKTPLLSSNSEESLILNFHILYMYIKKLSLCEEYRDLNTRHLKLLDIFVFEYNHLKIDLVFWYFFKSVKEKLISVKTLPQNEYRVNLESRQNKLENIFSFLSLNATELSTQIATDYPEVKQLGLQNFALKKKEERLLELVNTVFTKENIITIFENIYPRNDEQIRTFIKNWYQDYEATIPALFEYLLGISFYWISEKQFRISDILYSGLDANLLPKTHAPGGRADLIVRCKNKDYLIEATLSDNDGQRKMEAEPVPRHLAKHMLETNSNSLALFVAGQLDPNNLVVLRNYKFSSWYSSDGRHVESMGILPLTISNIIYLLKNESDFNEIENSFDTLLNSETQDGYLWFTKEVNTTFTNGNK